MSAPSRLAVSVDWMKAGCDQRVSQIKNAACCSVVACRMMASLATSRCLEILVSAPMTGKPCNPDGRPRAAFCSSVLETSATSGAKRPCRTRQT
ncbi:unnamed protein product [Symbiodinium pilosum]|uniref:Uncharacterized protein n=1 Tax=Symbiodinium pilosum TaxID=2952 RepID=A0A812Y4R5_SYMPI|nr:unnamed protein product [Symbiodinium pilosum]